VGTVPPSTGWGPARPNEGSKTEGDGTSSSTARGLRSYGNGVSYSRFKFSKLAPTCSTKCLNEIQNRIFENFHRGLSRYPVRFPNIFLLREKMMFCRNFISKIGYGHCFRFKLWQMFEWGSGLNFCLNLLSQVSM
jgi:hypothetical protein